VRTSVRYHQQLYLKQQQEEELRAILGECTSALQESIRLHVDNKVKDLPEVISRGLKRSRDYLDAERVTAVVTPSGIDEGIY
jgi:hypothetical protein